MQIAAAPTPSRTLADYRRPALVALAAIAVVALVLSALPGAYGAVRAGLARLPDAALGWIALAIAFEALSFLGHIVLFRTVFVDRSSRVGFAASYEITMAGHAATRLVGAAGAGGIALTVWALRRAGLGTRTIAARMAGFMVLLYSFYALSVAFVGIGLWSGLLPGGGSTALTLVPGLVAMGVVVAVLTAAWLAPRLPAARTVAEGAREAFAVIRHPRPGLLGGVMWWVFDIAVLWACYRSLGAQPAIAVIVLGYFLGLVGNSLPFLGSVGGVDGAMIAALIALGAPAAATIAAVIVYRLISCWLPAIPGAVAAVQLRRRAAEWDESAAPQPA